MTQSISKGVAWLIWIEGTGGKPEPQIWREPFVGTVGVRILTRHKLPDGVADRMSIDEIVTLTQIEARAV